MDDEFDKDGLRNKSELKKYGYLVMEVEAITSIFILIVGVELLPFSMI